MTEDQIKAAVKAAISEVRNEFWIDAERHYNDHRLLGQLPCLDKEEEENYKEDHRWMRSFRSSIADTGLIARRTIIGMLLVSGIAWIGNAALHFFLDTVKK